MKSTIRAKTDSALAINSSALMSNVHMHGENLQGNDNIKESL